MSAEDHGPIERADPEARRALWKRLADEKVAMLGTREVGGDMIARPVMPVKIEPEGRVWLFTAADGDIARDLRRDPNVHLTFMNPDDELFVSLNGAARVMQDADRARELWSTMAGVWYVQGPEDSNLAVVQIDVHRGDYWDMKDGKLVRFVKLATAAMAGARPDDVATHRRL